MRATREKEDPKRTKTALCRVSLRRGTRSGPVEVGFSDQKAPSSRLGEAAMSRSAKRAAGDAGPGSI